MGAEEKREERKKCGEREFVYTERMEIRHMKWDIVLLNILLILCFSCCLKFFFERLSCSESLSFLMFAMFFIILSASLSGLSTIGFMVVLWGNKGFWLMKTLIPVYLLFSFVLSLQLFDQLAENMGLVDHFVNGFAGFLHVIRVFFSDIVDTVDRLSDFLAGC